MAAVDCGTNSTRLLVSGPDGEPLVRLMQITRLGQDVDRTGVLAPGAIARTVAVLTRYRSVMDELGVTRLRMTSTSAARDADNREDFFSAAEQAVGARPELLGGDEEGRLSFAGATAELDVAEGPWLVADIGGGSTELAVGPAAGVGDVAGSAQDRLVPQAVQSLDMGCVRITERFLVDDPPTPPQLGSALGYIESLLGSVSASDPAFAVPLDGVTTLVGLAGTVAALASLDQELETYDRQRLHHHLLTRATVDGLLAELTTMTAVERLARPGMEAERADLIVGGTLILSALLRHFEIDVCLTSEADILDGLTMTLLAGSE